MNVSWPAFFVICGVLIAIVLVLFWHPQRSRRITSIPADHQPTSSVFRDDDRYWAGGLFYNNPDDPALFAPKRFGFGWTLNFGHPQSKRFIIIVLTLMLVLVLLPLVAALLGGVHASGCHSFGCQP